MKAYLIRLTGAAILGALLRKIAPEGGAGRGTRLGAGLLILLTALGPVGNVDLVSAAENLAQGGYVGGFSTESIQETSNQLLEELIIQSAQAYILDKAQALGVTVEAEVRTVRQNGYPIPWSVRLKGEASATEREKLCDMIANDLGIPAERQEW